MQWWWKANCIFMVTDHSVHNDKTMCNTILSIFVIMYFLGCFVQAAMPYSERAWRFWAVQMYTLASNDLHHYTNAQLMRHCTGYFITSNEHPSALQRNIAGQTHTATLRTTLDTGRKQFEVDMHDKIRRCSNLWEREAIHHRTLHTAATRHPLLKHIRDSVITALRRHMHTCDKWCYHTIESDAPHAMIMRCGGFSLVPAECWETWGSHRGLDS